MDQIKIHYKIDKLFLEEPGDRDAQEIRTLMSENLDSKNYFFTVANEKWLDWLWKNCLLDDIKKKADDAAQHAYRMPELHYLTRMIEKDPAKVAEIIHEVKISAATFNPEVTDQFLRICGGLPAEHLAKIAPQIRDENWVALMGAFNHLDFEFQKMFKTLSAADDFESVLTLAGAALSTKSKAEIIKEGGQAGLDSPFYFRDLAYTEVFENLLSVSDEYVEKSLDAVLHTLKNIVDLGEKSDGKISFEIEDVFYLFDLDFFTAEPGRKHSTYRESVAELAAVIKTLASRLVDLQKGDGEKLLRAYNEKIHTLPDSQLTWRFKLYFLSLAPAAYKDDIAETLERLFEAEDYHDIVSGAEYYKLLQNSFSELPDSFQQDYGKKVIEYFGELIARETGERKKSCKIYGSRILSSIADYLSDEVRNEAQEVELKIDLDFKPEPSIGSISGGFVREESPVSQEELSKLSVEKIVENLSGIWSPDALNEKYKGDDFLRPRNAEGMGNALKENILKRLAEYVNSAVLFFDVEKLSPHYTYSFLNGVKDSIKTDPAAAAKNDWQGIINLFKEIEKSYQEEGFSEEPESSSPRTWLANWKAVHSAMVDVLKELLADNDDGAVIDMVKYRSEIFKVLCYLLTYPDPIFDDEQVKTAKMTIKPAGDSNTYVSDPFSIAINSVRGRAFEAFVLFCYRDSKSTEMKLADDCKELYNSVLINENTRALMFLYGRNLPSFYHWDRDWLKMQLPIIFSTDFEKYDLYTAAWEGYLSNNLYEEIFFDSDFQHLYERGLEIQVIGEPAQKQFVELDEGIATHLALAYIFYERFNFEDNLFKNFLENCSDKQLANFINFIGRSISGDNKKFDDFVDKNEYVREKLTSLWDWVLDNKKDPEICDEFGMWINMDKNFFEIKALAQRVRKTLEATGGKLSWELGLSKCIVEFAKTSPVETFKIASLYLYDGLVKSDRSDMFLHIDNEWLEALTYLYNNFNEEAKAEIYSLINNLILEGGSVFWALKKVLD